MTNATVPAAGHRPARAIRAAIVAAAAVLFIGGGVLSILAAQVRWGEACADYDTAQCVIAQDHL